jgi:predicted Fe-Mo cluster-binding NifX family protein
MKPKIAQGKIAVTIWEHRVSPVFDSARTLLIAEIKDDVLVNTSYLAFDPDRPLELLQMLQAQKVMIIICGAVSEGPADILEGAGFELISFIAGDVHRVLETFLQGEPLGAAFKMPGCGKHICCRGKIRPGREINTLNKNGRREKSREPRCPEAVTNTCDDKNGSVTSAEMFVRLPVKS